jgi:glycosyltransferase involved in cell wall biosynthesis
MSEELLSVVVPSYNHEAFIGQAIESVIEQDYRPLELIIIDDGSKDGSCDIVRKYLPKIKAAGITVDFIARENRGAHNTINEGLSRAQGKWLTILNSDDYYFPGRLTTLIAAAKKNKRDFVFSSVTHVDETGAKASDAHPFRKWYVENLKREYSTVGFRLLDENIAVTTGNFLFTKQLFGKVGPFKDYVLIHDYDFILRSIAYTEPFWVQKELLAYRVHSTNTIASNSYLQKQEGPKVAFDFILRTILSAETRNQSAPWMPKHRKEFKRFWNSNPPRGTLRHWLGCANLFEIYSSQDERTSSYMKKEQT